MFNNFKICSPVVAQRVDALLGKTEPMDGFPLRQS
jgi:hypothetical protein